MTDDKKGYLPPEIVEEIKERIQGDRFIPDEEALDIGVAAENEVVILRFSRQVHWTSLTPELAIQIAEGLITAATRAADWRRKAQPIVRPGEAN